MAGPASAFFFGGYGKHFFFKKKIFKHKKTPGGGHGKFPWPVACVMGSAFGLISAASIKGGGLPLMSDTEFATTPRDRTKELTNRGSSRYVRATSVGSVRRTLKSQRSRVRRGRAEERECFASTSAVPGSHIQTARGAEARAAALNFSICGAARAIVPDARAPIFR
jgi:hypothetical protein